MERSKVPGKHHERPADLAGNARHGDEGGRPTPFGLK